MTQIGFKVGSPGSDWPTIEAIWRRAGELDVVESAWTNDHLDIGDGPVWEGWTSLALLSRYVPNKLVGHLVLANPFRRPVVLAKAAAVMDHATRGRFILGLGVGSWPAEFESLGIPLAPIADRLADLEATLRLLRAMFGRRTAEGEAALADDVHDPVERLTFDAGPYHLRDARLDPRPFTAGGPPIWLGTQGERTGMRLVAKYADGWNFGSEGGIDAFQRKRDALMRQCEANARDPASVAVSVQLPIADDLLAARREAEAYCRFGLAHFILFLDPTRGVAGLERAVAEVGVPIHEAFG